MERPYARPARQGSRSFRRNWGNFRSLARLRKFDRRNPMRQGLVGSLAVWLAAASVTWGQGFAPSHPGYSFPPVPGPQAPLSTPAAATPTYLPSPSELQAPTQPFIQG